MVPPAGSAPVTASATEAAACPGQARVAEVGLLPRVARAQASGRPVEAGAETTLHAAGVAPVAPRVLREAPQEVEVALGRLEAVADALAAVPAFRA